MKTAVAATAVALCLAVPGVASAARASLDLEPSDLGPGIMVENLNYRAAPGEANRLTVGFKESTGVYTLTDTVGITPGANCARPHPSDSTRVTCSQTSGTMLGGVLIKLGDRNDHATVSGHSAVVLGGAGSDVLKGSGFDDTLSAGDSTFKQARAHTRDRLVGNGGNDFLLGSRGNNVIDGGKGHDTIRAGFGSDRINARDGQVDEVHCGRGNDRVKLDTADFLVDRCRGVLRPGRAAATPIFLFVSGRKAYVTIGCPRDVLVSRCTGTLKLSRGHRKLGGRGFSIRPGRRLTPDGIRLPHSILSKIGPNGGPRLKVRVKSGSGPHTITTFIVRMAIPPPGD